MITDRARLAEFAAVSGFSTYPGTDLDLELTDTYAIDCYIMDTTWSPAGELMYAEYFSGGPETKEVIGADCTDRMGHAKWLLSEPPRDPAGPPCTCRR